MRTDEERMEEAVRVFRRMIPTLSSYAKAITGRRDVRVVLAPTSAMTDGKNIFYRPPLALGDKLKHNRTLCDKRDPITRLQVCPACEVRERVLVNIYHEIGHIAFQSFTDLSERDRLAAFEQAVREMGKSHAVTLEAAKRATIGVSTYKGLAGLINPYLPTLLNGIEDARVDGMMCAARKGIRVMMQASSNQIFRDGAEGMDSVKWSEYPLNAQVALACMLRIMNYEDWEDHLNPSVVEHTRMPGVEAILTRLRESRQASETFLLAYPLMEELRKYGYFQKPDEIPDMPPMGDGSDDKDEDDSGNSDSDSSEEGGDSGSGGGSSSPSQEQDEENSPEPPDSQASSDGDADEGDADDSDGGSGSGETDTDSDPGRDDVDEDGSSSGSDPEEKESGSDSSGEPGDSSSTRGGVPGEQDSDPDSPDDAGDPSDSRGHDPEDSDPSATADPDDGAGHGGEDSDSEEGASSTDEGGDVPPQDSTPTEELGEDDDGDATESGNGDDSRGDDGGSDDSETSSSGADESQDDGDSDPSDAPGDGDEPSDERDGDDREASEDPSGDGERGVDDDPGTMGEAGEGEDPEASSLDDDGEDLDAGESSAVPEGSPDSTEEQEADDSEDAVQEQHQHGVDGQPCNCGHCATYGTPSQVADEVDQVHTKMAHADLDEEDEPSPEELKQFEEMIKQGMYFDTRSEEVSGVNFYRDGYRFFNTEKPTEIPEEYLGPALLQTRRTFSDNQKATDNRNLKRGRVDAGKLAKRAPFQDPRMFQRRQQPGKKDYSVLLGMDLSSSSIGHEAEQIRLFTMAQAELCHRAGIRFAVYGHSGEGFWKEPGNREKGIGFNMDIVVVKEFDEPWGPEAIRRMSMVQPSGGNLDGHTMEFYRKRLDEERTTDRVIVYYTDGEMPATNFDEELDILQRELRTCRNKGYTVMAVGIGTDSPVQHGLDTYVAQGFEDIKGVVMHLEKRLVNR